MCQPFMLMSCAFEGREQGCVRVISASEACNAEGAGLQFLMIEEDGAGLGSGFSSQEAPQAFNISRKASIC